MRTYTIEQFIEAVNKSVSIRNTLQKLNLSPCGGNYLCFHKLVKMLKLDLSHFLGRGHNKGKCFGPKRSLEDYLSNRWSIPSHVLKLRLIKENYFLHECCNCKLSQWLGKLIPLELHHRDGNRLNNNLNNLELLCPNCHAFTDNYRGKNVKKKKKKHTLVCNSKKSKRRTVKPYIRKTKIVWPSYNELLNLLETSNYSKLSRQLGVSDNAIRKRLKNHSPTNSPTPICTETGINPTEA